ncbi:MAG: hypothetical protein WHS87_10350 [Anaerolineales bacterium]
MRSLIAFPLLFLVAILQSALFSRLSLLNGHADLMLIVLAIWSTHPRVAHAWEWTLIGAMLIAFLSAFPWPLTFLLYLIPTALAQTLRAALRSHVLSTLIVLFTGTLLMGLLGWGYLFILQSTFSVSDIFGEIVSPSLLLNILLTLPAFILITRLANWVYPGEEE